MRTLEQMAIRVCKNINLPPASAYTSNKIYEYLNSRYRKIYYHQFWPKTCGIYRINIPVNVSDFSMPKFIGTILRIVNETTGDVMFLIDVAAYADKCIALQSSFRTFFEMESDIPTGTKLGTSNVFAQPISASKLSVVSTSTNDNSSGTIPKIFIRGRDANQHIVSEVVSVNGTTPVTTTNTYLYVDAITKSLGNSTVATSSGVISLNAPVNTNQGTTLIADLDIWETSPEYERVKLEESVTTDSYISVAAQRRFVPFLNTADVPIFDMEDALVAGATADSWREQEKMDNAQIWEGLFQEEMKTLLRRNMEGSGNAQICIPMGRA